MMTSTEPNVIKLLHPLLLSVENKLECLPFAGLFQSSLMFVNKKEPTRVKHFSGTPSLGISWPYPQL
jgi:hypothetical protein